MTHLATWPHCVNTTWSSAGFIKNLMKYNELFTHVLQGSLTGSIIPVSMGNPEVSATIGLYQITATVFTMVGLYCRHPNGTRIFTLANAFRNCWHNKKYLRTFVRSSEGWTWGTNCSLALSPMYWDPLGALLGIRWNIKNSQVHFSAETWAVTTVSNMANIKISYPCKRMGTSDMKRRRFLC